MKNIRARTSIPVPMYYGYDFLPTNDFWIQAHLGGTSTRSNSRPRLKKLDPREAS